MKRLNFYIYLLLVSFSVPAQNLDESFLKSLPSEIQEDILNKSSNKSDNDTNFPNPDTRIKNLESALDDAKSTLDRIEDELDRANDEKPNELKRFGDNFFQSFQSTFLPINAPNLDSTYILDVGDELSLQLIGQKKLSQEITIKRNGSVNIPDIGEITLAGLTMLEAIQLVKNSVSQAFIGVDTFLSLTKLRDISVLIIGNVNKPGMYTLSGGSSPLSLIQAAGGIDTNGSFRQIFHKRGNELIQEIDLYDVFINGNSKFNRQLRSGDVIIVSPKLLEIRVTGGVSNPGIYEMKDGETLSELINYLGLSKKLLTNYALINRLVDGKYVKNQIDLSNIGSFQPIDGDAIEIYSITPEFNGVKKVTISGEVNIPGEYNLTENTSISDLIKIAGGYKKNAYPFGGVLLRKSVRDLEIEMRERSYEALLRYIISSPSFLGSSNNFSSGSISSESIASLLSMIKNYKPSGRLVTEFNLDKLNQNKSLDRILDDGDHIHVPQFINEIYVFGAVMNPGSVPFKNLYTLSDYLISAGNFSRSADKTRVLVISPDGRIMNPQKSFINIFSSGEFELLPGTVIYVPEVPAKIDGINLASSLAPIISSFALSVASLNSINN